MVTNYVSSESMAVLLRPGEADDIRRVISLCLSSAGLKPWADIEAELFNSDDGCLLLARPRPPLRQRGTYRRHIH